MQTYTYNQIKPFIFWTDFNGCISSYIKKLNIKYTLKLDEQRFNGIYFKRTVVIYFNDLPCMYCFTYCDAKTYKKFQFILDNLGDKPIGENLLYHKNYKWKKEINNLFITNDKKEIQLQRNDKFSMHEYCIHIRQTFTDNIKEILSCLER